MNVITENQTFTIELKYVTQKIGVDLFDPLINVTFILRFMFI